jgi:chromosome partitioning protein
MGKVWAISTNKGGVLKTSITTNLAGVLSSKNRVLIIDTDNQGNCLLSFGKNPDAVKTTLYDVIVQGVAAEKAIVNVYKNIDILPANDDMAFFEFDVLSEPKKYPNPFRLLRDRLQTLKTKYDYVLVDTPPNLGLTQANVLCFVDQVLIPFQPESYSMRSLVKMIKAIDDFREKHNPKLSVLGVLATLVDMRTNLHTQTLQECRAYCKNRNINMFDAIIPRTVRYAASVAYDRLPATLADPKHLTAKNYYELIEEVEKNEKK